MLRAVRRGRVLRNKCHMAAPDAAACLDLPALACACINIKLCNAHSSSHARAQPALPPLFLTLTLTLTFNRLTQPPHPPPQNYFTRILEDNLKAIIKPQYVDHIPKVRQDAGSCVCVWQETL